MAGMDAEELREAEVDKAWTGPKFISLGLVTLLIAVSIIYYLSSLSGCRLVVVP